MADPQDLMQQMLEGIVTARQANPPPTLPERQAALSKYTEAVRGAGTDTRAPYEVMMEGITTSRNPLDPQMAMQDMFRGLANWRATQREAEFKRQTMAAKAEYDDITARMKDSLGGGSLGSLRTALGPQGFEPRKNADGTTTVYSRATGMPVGTYGPQDIGKITALTQTLAKAALERGEYNTLDEATRWAEQEAIRQVGSANATVGNRLSPLGGNIGGVPTTPPAEGAATIEDTDASPTGTSFKFDVSALGPDERVQVQRLIDRYRANPNGGTAEATAKEIMRLIQAKKVALGPAAAVPPVEAAPEMPKKDVRRAEFKGEWGKKEASTLEKALTESTSTLGKASGLISTLNNLEGLLNVDNMPEGEFAPFFNKAQSALKSLGVDIKGPVGPGQVATAMANEMALRLRTGQGENLMPGAMSNFDAQLLLSMAPNLSQTREGRNMLIQFMRSAAESQRRIAEAAQRMAADNGGILPPEWREVATKMEKQEMAKRELMRRKIMGGAK